MPSRKANDGEFKDIAHPINSEARQKIQEAVISGYEKALVEFEAAADNEAEWHKNWWQKTYLYWWVFLLYTQKREFISGGGEIGE